MSIFDNHLHLRRDGRFLDAVAEFQKAGGTHFALCQYPMVSQVLKDGHYRACYQQTLKMAEEIRQATPIGVFVTVGPYPVDYLKLNEHYGRERALEIMKAGMDEAARLCEHGDCIAIGEIGRPHFPVDAQFVDDSNEILLYGMEKAHDVDVPVVLHTESTTTEQCRELVDMGKKAGLLPHKIVKHFSPPLILEQENYGLMPSVLASKQNITTALRKGTRFLMETDYIDDPKRPGAVLSPKTVPKRTKMLLDQGLLTDQQAYQIHTQNPEKTYGLSLEG